MRILLDTHAFIWWDTDPARLSPRAFALCMDSGNQIVLSTASLWEMAIKAHLGKLRLTKSLAQIVADQQQANRLEILPVGLIHVLELETLPTVHKDPFDRILVAQAKVEAMPLVTRDTILASYAIAVEW